MSLRVFGPLVDTPDARHVIGARCHVCGGAIGVGDFYTLLPTGPADADESAAAAAGRPFNARAELAHSGCASWRNIR